MRLGHEVLHVNRETADGPAGVSYEDADGTWGFQECGRVVVNVPYPEVAASGLVDLTSDETDVLGDLGRCNEWQTYLIEATDPGDLAYVDTWPPNYKVPGEVATTRFTSRFLDDSEANDGPEEFVALALNASSRGRGKRVIQHRFNMSAFDAKLERKASTLRVRPER